MKRDLKRLDEETFDVLVVGGGVNGLATAWDATLRGFKVALIEQGDFGGATSANSLKIIHGGLRYLQHLDFRRMHASIQERSRLMRMAPHLIRPLPFLVPAYGHGVKGKLAMATASRINDFVGRKRNRFLDDLGRTIPNGRKITRDECLHHIPGLDPNGLRGGVIFYDGQMENADRVTLAFALSAAARGAAITNYVSATGFIREAGRVVGVKATDQLGGQELEIRARIVANLAGPWAPFLIRELYPEKERGDVPLSKGFQIVTPDLTGGLGLAVTSRHHDPDAVIKRGGRHYFIAPWRGHSIIGNTDTAHSGDPSEWRIEPDEIAAFVEEINQAFPAAGLTPDQVVHAFGGIQLADARRMGKGAQVAKHPVFIDHRRDLNLSGLLTVIGVKYTTCRWLAEKTTDRLCKVLGYQRAPCRTDRTPLLGGDLGHIKAFREKARSQARPDCSEKVLDHLARTYGTQYSRLITLIEKQPTMATLVPGSTEVTHAQIVHAIRHEAAVHLDDVVMRRTGLGTLGHPGEDVLQACAALMAVELEWDDARQSAELARMSSYFPVPQ